jgi:3-phenylpropionate/trans-cinnamate dioxygenase ferredoxin reductase subunit
MSRFVIVGAGECGARAAFALREKGFGGQIVLVGSEALAPYERPPLSKDGLRLSSEPKYVAAPERYFEAGIELRTGITVAHVDVEARSIVLSNDEVIAYDKLLLATGAAPRAFPNVAGVGGRIRTLRTHADADALREQLRPDRHIAIIGGGFIGLELAATARKMGAKVTVIEGLPRILSRGVPAEIADVLALRHGEEGVGIRCGETILSLQEDMDAARIVLASETIEADLVLVGIGARPNTGLAATAGLATDNGIAVNERLETSATDIFAAGDCCSFPLALYGGRRVRLESWRNAQEQGTLAAANMLGAGETISAVPWFWSDQYDLTLQIAGLADDAAMVLRRDLPEDAFLLFHLDATGRLIAAAGIGRGNAVARDIRLAEMLIAAEARPDPAALVTSDIKLRSLLAA